MESFLNPFGFILHIHLVKNPQRAFVKRKLNLEANWTNHLSHLSGPIKFVASSLEVVAVSLRNRFAVTSCVLLCHLLGLFRAVSSSFFLVPSQPNGNHCLD